MAVNFASAISAYANAGKMKGPGLAVGESAGGFGDLLKQAAGDTISTMKQGELATIKAATGKADIAEVAAAVSNAEVALQTVAAVRDRVISAYQEILRMPM